MYVLHGTHFDNVLKILKSGYINTKTSGNLKTLTIPVNQIFAHLLYRDIPRETIQYPYMYACCFVLSIDILKNYKFYATAAMGYFNDDFNEGYKEGYVIRGSGKMKRLPNLNKLKQVINDTDKKRPWLETTAFIHSHEILFNKNISLKKYCLVLVIPKFYEGTEFHKKIKQYTDKFKIEIRFTDKNDKNGWGLNKFIDLIES